MSSFTTKAQRKALRDATLPPPPASEPELDGINYVSMLNLYDQAHPELPPVEWLSDTAVPIRGGAYRHIKYLRLPQAGSGMTFPLPADYGQAAATATATAAVAVADNTAPSPPLPPSFARKMDAKQYAAMSAVGWLRRQGFIPDDGSTEVVFPKVRAPLMVHPPKITDGGGQNPPAKRLRMLSPPPAAPAQQQQQQSSVTEHMPIAHHSPMRRAGLIPTPTPTPMANSPPTTLTSPEPSIVEAMAATQSSSPSINTNQHLPNAPASASHEPVQRVITLATALGITPPRYILEPSYNAIPQTFSGRPAFTAEDNFLFETNSSIVMRGVKGMPTKKAAKEAVANMVLARLLEIEAERARMTKSMVRA